jgi:5'(3')-deoxyribonucleotidase
MTLNIDLDGVLYNFHEEISKFVEEDPRLITNWNIWDCWGITKNDFYNIFNKFIESGGFLKGEPEADAVDTLKILSKKHLINICTSRSTQNRIDVSAQVRRHTVDWLLKYKIPHQNLFFLREKELVGGLLLDDNMEFLETYRKVGVSICFNRPWNKEYHGLRVRNWKEFGELGLL